MVFINSKDIMGRLPALLRERRVGSGLTQANLAAKANVSLGVLRKFEQTGQISLESFIKLAFVLDLAEAILKAIEGSVEIPKTIEEVIKKNALTNDKTNTKKRVRK